MGRKKKYEEEVKVVEKKVESVDGGKEVRTLNQSKDTTGDDGTLNVRSTPIT